MKNIGLVAFLSVFLVACSGSGGSGGNGATSKTGVFIDAPVEGLSYLASPSGKSGVTNQMGEFEYMIGDVVSFSLGNIKLGDGRVDKDDEIKVTQFGVRALPVAQLLQSLDTDADKDFIDVSGLEISEQLGDVIEGRLDSEDEDVLSQDEFETIKNDNPEVLAEDLVSREEALEHISEQIPDSGLVFSYDEVANTILTSRSLLDSFDGVVMIFNTDTDLASIIDVEGENQAGYSEYPWGIVGGKIQVEKPNNEICDISKLAEGSDGDFDIKMECSGDNTKIFHMLSAKSFGMSDLAGESFTIEFEDNNDTQQETITFSDSGTYIIDDGEKVEEPRIYKESNFKNTLWFSFSNEYENEGVLFLRIRGTLNNGNILAIEYDRDNLFHGIQLIKSDENIWNFLFETYVSISADDITSGLINFPGGITPANAYVRLVPQAFQQDDSDGFNYADGLRCKVQNDGSWGVSECLIHSQSAKDYFTQDSLYQFIVFEDANGDAQWGRDEQSLCFLGSSSAWNSWANINCSP